ncbi:MAG: extracellular solute-binding protein [Neisseria sp.]|nr:extracellular solute-binding protein [Neisseria sp.]
MGASRLGLWCLLLLFQAAFADFGMALGGKPKYGKDFTHFAYVNPHAPKRGMLTVPLTGSFDTLNPLTLKGSKEAGVSLLTLDTLLMQSEDEPFAAYGLIADDVVLADNGLAATFRIHPQARFHNGDRVSAHDVVYSFRTLTQDQAADPLYRFYWAGVAKVQALDERSVRFDFKEKNAELHLILGQLPVFSHKSFPQGLAAAGNVVPIGSGPYRLQRTVSGRMSEFVRDPAYWAQNLPTRRGMYNFDTIRFKYYQDETARVEALKAGEYDVIAENVARLWARAYPEKVLQKRGLVKNTFAHRNNAGMQGFVLNLRREALQDEALRRALVLSFDFESVNQLLFYGLYRRADSFFTNTELAATGLPEGDELRILRSVQADVPSDIFSTPAVMPPVIDPQLGVRPNLIRARDGLLAAGYVYREGYVTDAHGRRVGLELLLPGKAFERAAAKWQRDLAKIGITLQLRTTDAALFQKRLNDFDYDIALVGYGNSLSPGNEQFNYHSCAAARTAGSQNYAGICDPAVEKILPYFLNPRDRDELVAASRALDRILRRKHMIVPNWYADRHRMIYRADLRQPETLPLYYQGLTWAIQTWWR